MKMAAHEGAAGDRFGNRFSHDSHTTSGQSPQTFVRLDELVFAQVRAIWWRQIRLGNRLPAQRGLILIDGGGDGL